MNGFRGPAESDDLLLYLGQLTILYEKAKEGLSEEPEKMKNMMSAVRSVAAELDKKFKCAMCGSCCNQLIGVNVSITDMMRLGKALKMHTDEFKKRYVTQKEGSYLIGGGDWCPLIRNKRCSVYKDRPKICKAFPIRTPLTECYLFCCVMRAVTGKDILPSPFRCPGFYMMEDIIRTYVGQAADRLRK